VSFTIHQPVRTGFQVEAFLSGSNSLVSFPWNVADQQCRTLP
jgi:hypothetical protein